VRPVTDAFRSKLTQQHRRVTRVSALDSAFEPIPGAILSGEQGYAVNGSVTIDRRRASQRTCSLTVANPEGVWTPRDAADFFFFGNAIRIERGIRITDELTEWVTLGIFLVDIPTIEIGTAGVTLGVNGQDRMKRAAYSKFAAPTTYTSATRIRDVIADLALDAGMGATRIALDDAGKTLAADRVYDSQEGRLSAMLDLAHDYALDLRVDAEGVLVLEPTRNLTELATVWTFQRGEEAVMLGLTKSFSDQRFYNHVVVVGESADQSPVRGEAMDLNPASPGYIYGPLGDRTYFYSSAMITTTGQAQEVANAFLPEVSLLEEDIRLPIVVNPALEAGDAIAIIEDMSRTDDRYIIDSIDIPLGAGSSTIQTKKLRPLS
jgi:hypothetical protein